MRSRLQAAAARGLTRFVGRQPELETVQQALARAQAGHGQVVALVGDAGVGKSRLVYECSTAQRTQGWLVLESAAVSYGKRPPTSRCVDLLQAIVQSTTATTPAPPRQSDGAGPGARRGPPGDDPALLALLEALPDGQPVSGA